MKDEHVNANVEIVLLPSATGKAYSAADRRKISRRHSIEGCWTGHTAPRMTASSPFRFGGSYFLFPRFYP